MSDATPQKAESERRAITRVEVVDAVSWDDRKQLATLWQDHCPLPAGGLSGQFYDAVIAVAAWGADSLWELGDPLTPPVQGGATDQRNGGDQ